MKLPYLTNEFPGVGGTIKQRAEDFFVQELPLYEPSGTGEHIFVEIQKVNITTFEAIARLSKALNVPARDIGYAGLKDAIGVSRQILSIPRTTPHILSAIRVEDVTVQWALPHHNKLRRGHLSGNRFAINLRDVTPTDVVKLPPVLKILQQRGMANYFGPQRFGRRGDNAVCGELLLRGRHEQLLAQLLGRPDASVDTDEAAEARAAFDRGAYEEALAGYPRNYGLERRILSRFMKTKSAEAAVGAVDQKLRKLWISALQSQLFNEVLARRIETLDQLLEGDVAMRHDSGGCFIIKSPEIEQARCNRFEISPTGPMIGYRMTRAQARAGEIEEQVFAAHRLTAEDFRGAGVLRVKGDRRPLRVKPTEVSLSAGVDQQGAYITLAFTLPPGAYATSLIREISKNA